MAILGKWGRQLFLCPSKCDTLKRFPLSFVCPAVYIFIVNCDKNYCGYFVLGILSCVLFVLCVGTGCTGYTRCCFFFSVCITLVLGVTPLKAGSNVSVSVVDEGGPWFVMSLDHMQCLLVGHVEPSFLKFSFHSLFWICTQSNPNQCSRLQVGVLGTTLVDPCHSVLGEVFQSLANHLRISKVNIVWCELVAAVFCIIVVVQYSIQSINLNSN